MPKTRVWAGSERSGIEVRTRAEPVDARLVGERSRLKAEVAAFRSRIKAEAESVLSRIKAGEDSAELAEAASELCLLLSGEGSSRPYLAELCCEGLPAGPLVRGSVLRDVWTHGHHGSTLALAGYCRIRVLRWFQQASRVTLMTKAECTVLDGLTETIVAFRLPTTRCSAR